MWNTTTVSGITIHTMTGFEANLSGLTGRTGVTVTGAGTETSTYDCSASVAIVVNGTLMHNGSAERLIMRKPALEATRTTFDVATASGKYRTTVPAGHWNTAVILPSGTLAGDIIYQTSTSVDSAAMQWNGTAWVSITSGAAPALAPGTQDYYYDFADVQWYIANDDRTAWIEMNEGDDNWLATRWTGGEGLQFASPTTIWWNRTIEFNSSRGASLVVWNGGEWYTEGGFRVIGNATFTLNRGTTNATAGTVICYTSSVIQAFGNAITDPFPASPTNNRAPRTYLVRLLRGSFRGTGFSTSGLNVSVGRGAPGTTLSFGVQFTDVGYWMQTQNDISFNPANTNTITTIRDGSAIGCTVDISPYRLNNRKAGSRFQNFLAGSAANVNGGQTDAQLINNAGYLFFTRQLETGFASGSGVTPQGVMYSTDTDNGNRRLTNADTAYDDRADSVYTIGFDETINSFTRVGGTAIGICDLFDQNELLLGTFSLSRDVTAPRLRDSDNFVVDRRGLNNSDVHEFDVWSYEHEYQRVSPNLAGNGVFTFSNVLNTDRFISRDRTAIASYAPNFTYTNTAYTVTGDTSLSDIYDVVKYNKETDATQRNVPSVTTIPLGASDAGLDLGSRSLTLNGDLSAGTVFGTVMCGPLIVNGNVDGVSPVPTTLAIIGARTFSNGSITFGTIPALPAGTVFTDWTFNTDAVVVNDWSEAINTASTNVTFAGDATIRITDGGDLADLFSNVNFNSGSTYTLTAASAETVTFPIGTTIANNSATVDGVTYDGGTNVTLVALQVTLAQFATAPSLLEVSGFYTDQKWSVYNISGDTTTLNKTRTALYTSEANSSLLSNGILRLRSGVDSNITSNTTQAQRDAIFPDTTTQADWTELSGLGTSTANRFLIINGNRAYTVTTHGIVVVPQTQTFNYVDGGITSNTDTTVVPFGLQGVVDVTSFEMSYDIDLNVSAASASQTDVTITLGDFTLDGNTIGSNFRFIVSGHSNAVDGQFKAKAPVTNAIFASARDDVDYRHAVYLRLDVHGEAVSGDRRIIPSLTSFTSTVRYTWEPLLLASIADTRIRRTHGYVDGGASIETAEALYISQDNNAGSLLAPTDAERILNHSEQDVSATAVSEQATMFDDVNATVQSEPVSLAASPEQVGVVTEGVLDERGVTRKNLANIGLNAPILNEAEDGLDLTFSAGV